MPQHVESPLVPAGQGHPYPQLIIKYLPAVYGVIPLADDLTVGVLFALVRSAVEALGGRNRMCLVLGPAHAVYVETDGSWTVSRHVPLGGVRVTELPPELGFLPVQRSRGDGAVAPRRVSWRERLFRPVRLIERVRRTRAWRRVAGWWGRMREPFTDWMADYGWLTLLAWLVFEGWCRVAGGVGR